MSSEADSYISISYLGDGEYGLLLFQDSTNYHVIHRGKTASDMFKMAMKTFDNSHTIYIPDTINLILDLEARELFNSLIKELSDVVTKTKFTPKKPSGLGKAKKKPLGNSNDAPTPQGEEGASG